MNLAFFVYVSPECTHHDRYDFGHRLCAIGNGCCIPYSPNIVDREIFILLQHPGPYNSHQLFVAPPTNTELLHYLPAFTPKRPLHLNNTRRAKINLAWTIEFNSPRVRDRFSYMECAPTIGCLLGRSIINVF